VNAFINAMNFNRKVKIQQQQKLLTKLYKKVSQIA